MPLIAIVETELFKQFVDGVGVKLMRDGSEAIVSRMSSMVGVSVRSLRLRLSMCLSLATIFCSLLAFVRHR